MIRKVITTEDGSSSIFVPELQEHYHSIHGAIQEAKHVFIKNGLSLFKNTEVAILEIGFGTGLNCFITFLEAKKNNLKIHYKGIEAYPINFEESKSLNYIQQLQAEKNESVFAEMHTIPWGINTALSPEFTLTKSNQFFTDIKDVNEFDLIYFDAFGAQVQPELWTETIFLKMYNALKNNGILVTYSAKGSVRRALISVGFRVEKLPGPPGKREMLRAKKNDKKLNY